MMLSEAVGMFESDMSRRSRSTARAYMLAVRQLVEHVSGDMDIQDLTCDHLLATIRKANVRSVTPNTLASYIGGLSVFATFLILEHLVKFDQADLARLRQRARALIGRHPRHLPHVPTDDEVAAIIDAAASEPATTDRKRILVARNVALLHCLRSTGARVGELVGLRRRDLNADEKTAVVVGKGDKQRLVFFDDEAWAAMDAYLSMRADHGSPNGQPVFARHDRHVGGQILPMTTTAVRDLVTRCAILAGLDDGIHPHLFRHRVGMKVLGATGDLGATQDILGHASPATTRIYATLTGQQLKAAHRAAKL